MTIAPSLLAELEATNGEVSNKLNVSQSDREQIAAMTHSEFLWEHNQDAMAVEKLAEGIRNFAIDQKKLESMIKTRL